MNGQEWEDLFFRTTFDAVVETVTKRRKYDGRLTKEEVRSQLEQLYELEGQDQFGRGRVADIDIEASIAALQFVLSEWDISCELV